jgi:hypothetical protein
MIWEIRNAKSSKDRNCHDQKVKKTNNSLQNFTNDCERVKNQLTSTNTDRLKQVDDDVRGCTWYLSRVKAIYMFHRLVLHRRDSSFEWFNRETHNYGMWWPVPVGHRMRGKLKTGDQLICPNGKQFLLH